MASGQLDLHPENAGEDFNININGAAPNANGHLLDGVENTEAIQGLSLVVPPQDAVQEVKLATSNYDAEYGKVAGGLWQTDHQVGHKCFSRIVVRKLSHVWFQRGRSVQSAPTAFPAIAGISLAAASAARLSRTSSFSSVITRECGTTSIPQALTQFRSMLSRTGDFSSIAATNPIYDPATGNPDGTGRTQFDCDGVLNVICPDRISQAATNLLALLAAAECFRRDKFELSDISSGDFRPEPVRYPRRLLCYSEDCRVREIHVIFKRRSLPPMLLASSGRRAAAGWLEFANAGNSSDHDKSFMVELSTHFFPIAIDRCPVCFFAHRHLGVAARMRVQTRRQRSEFPI